MSEENSSKKTRKRTPEEQVIYDQIETLKAKKRALTEECDTNVETLLAASESDTDEALADLARKAIRSGDSLTVCVTDIAQLEERYRALRAQV